VAVINSGEVIYSKEYNKDLEFVIPEEGTEVWTDCWAIPKTAKNKAGAEAWINFMLDGEVAADNFEYLTYAIPNVKIEELISEPVLNPSEEILARCETLKNLGSSADDMYSTYWKKYKAE
jgi:spermidine/putrescine-binding protein